MSWMTAPGMVAASCHGLASGLTWVGARGSLRSSRRTAPSGRPFPSRGIRDEVTKVGLLLSLPRPVAIDAGTRATIERTKLVTRMTTRVDLIWGCYLQGSNNPNRDLVRSTSAPHRPSGEVA